MIKSRRKQLGWVLTLACSVLLLLAILTVPEMAQAQTTFTVDSNGDGGDSNTGDGVCNDGTGNCTLRAAIEQANALAGADIIEFNIVGTPTIVLGSVLPNITDDVTIDGSSQPGFSGTPLIDVDANSLGGIILTVTANNTTLNDFIISNAPVTALLVNTASNVMNRWPGSIRIGR